VSLLEVWSTYQKIRRAQLRKYPLVFYVTMDNQVAVLVPYQVVGPLLMLRFQGQEVRVLYDKTKAVWFMGRPAIFVREGQLYPVDFHALVYLQHIDALAPIYKRALAEHLPSLEARGGGGQGDPSPLAEQAKAAISLLRSSHPIDKLNGVIAAAELLRQLDGTDWLVKIPLDPSVLDNFRPREEDLNIIMREFDMMAISKVVSMLGLAEALRKPDVGGILRFIIFGAFVLLGLFLFAYVLSGLLSAAGGAVGGGGVVVP